MRLRFLFALALGLLVFGAPSALAQTRTGGKAEIEDIPPSGPTPERAGPTPRARQVDPRGLRPSRPSEEDPPEGFAETDFWGYPDFPDRTGGGRPVPRPAGSGSPGAGDAGATQVPSPSVEFDGPPVAGVVGGGDDPCAEGNAQTVTFGNVPLAVLFDVAAKVGPIATVPAANLPDLRVEDWMVVRNAGNAAAGPSHLRLACTAFQDGQPVGTCAQTQAPVPAIPSGGSYAYMWHLASLGPASEKCNAGPDYCVITLTADTHQEVAEANEGNNSSSFTICPD